MLPSLSFSFFLTQQLVSNGEGFVYFTPSEVSKCDESGGSSFSRCNVTPHHKDGTILL